jgi:hypothetical protein
MADPIANRKLDAVLLALKEAGLVKYGVDENGDINVIYADTDGIQKFKGDLDIAGDFTIELVASPGTNIGDVGLIATGSGGATPYKNIDVDEGEDEVKGTAGQIYWVHAINLSAVVLYLKFYNATAANVTVGTTVPDFTFPIPSNGGTDGAGFVLPMPIGTEFDTAITIAATTGVADGDSGAPGANEVIVNMGYA